MRVVTGPRIAQVTWIEGTCRRRQQHRLGRLTPIWFEATMSTAAPGGRTQHVTYRCSPRPCQLTPVEPLIPARLGTSRYHPIMRDE